MNLEVKLSISRRGGINAMLIYSFQPMPTRSMQVSQVDGHCDGS